MDRLEQPNPTPVQRVRLHPPTRREFSGLEQFYVTVSRGRSAVRIYTDDREQVREAISVSGARGSAIELVEGKVNTKLKPVSRKERLIDFSESIARHATRLAKERGRELTFDKELMREAKQLAALEHKGRVRDHGAELGD